MFNSCIDRVPYFWEWQPCLSLYGGLLKLKTIVLPYVFTKWSFNKRSFTKGLKPSLYCRAYIIEVFYYLVIQSLILSSCFLFIWSSGFGLMDQLTSEYDTFFKGFLWPYFSAVVKWVVLWVVCCTLDAINNFMGSFITLLLFRTLQVLAVVLSVKCME